MKIIMIIGLMLSLQACLATTQFNGKSATFGGDNILRNDVMNSIRQYERSVSNCNEIEKVNSQIIEAKKVNGLMVVDEVWELTACGVESSYTVNLREDERGETDYRIGRR